MRITVIIATRDRAALLRDALASVAFQTRPVDEIIVIDDSISDTAAADVCQGFPDVIYMRSGGKGLGAARNIGTAKATGDIVVVQDDDDVMMPSRIADHVAAFVGDVQVTCGAWINVTSRARDALLRLVPGHAVPTLDGLLLGSACLAHGAAAYRTELLRKHPYDEALQAGADMDLHARLLADRAVFRHTQTVVLVRRLHAESVTQRFGDAQKSVKDGLKSRHLAPGYADEFATTYARPVLVRADFERALDVLGIDGARSLLGGTAKTLAAAVALAPRAGGAGALAVLGQGGFVDVVVPVAAAQLSDMETVAGFAPLKNLAAAQESAAVDADHAASLGLADGGSRILIDIDGLDMAALAAMNAGLSTVSPSWRFVAGHPALAMAFAASPKLAMASNRFVSTDSLARAFQAAAYAAGRLRLPLTRLGVGTVRKGVLFGLKA